MSEELRDQIAQTIDPKASAFRGKAHLWPEATLRWKAALAKADSILALIDHLEADGRLDETRRFIAEHCSTDANGLIVSCSSPSLEQWREFAPQFFSALPVLGVGR